MILLEYPSNGFRLLSKSNLVDTRIPPLPQYWYRIHQYIARYCFPNIRWCQDKQSHWKKACNHLGKYKWMILGYLCSALIEESDILVTIIITYRKIFAFVQKVIKSILVLAWARTYIQILSCTFIDIPTVMTIRIRFVSISTITNEIARNVFTSSIITAWVKTCFALIHINTFFRSGFHFKTWITIAVKSTKFVETGALKMVYFHYFLMKIFNLRHHSK